MELVNFGKHSGKPVEILLQDEDYCRWLNAQNWFLAKYAELHKQIQERHFLNEETPVHNAMQLKWLDPDILIKLFAVISLRRDRLIKWGLSFPKRFSDLQSDAISAITPEGSGYWDVQFKASGFDCYVELKPQLGDDYPSVLRKMMSQKRAGVHGFYFLVAASLASAAADKEALIKFFALQQIFFVLEEEFQFP